MIEFNNNFLEDIAPVSIDDIKVSPIQINPIVRQRIGFGQDLIRVTGSTRTVTITFALLTDDIDARTEQLEAIKAWANPYNVGTLKLPMYPGKYLSCMCTSYPEPSYRMWWESKLRLVFTTYDNPYLTSEVENTQECGKPITVGGNAPPLMQIRRTLGTGVANQTYASGGKSMVFSQIPAGDLVIDLNRQTAAVSGNSIMKNFKTTSKFIEPRTGTYTISGTGNVYFRERWV